MINISVFYASTTEQIEIALEVEANCTVALAIKRSNITQKFKEIDFSNIKVGIYGKKVLLDAPLQDNDRIEIYRELEIDPKTARRNRAAKAKK